MLFLALSASGVDETSGEQVDGADPHRSPSHNSSDAELLTEPVPSSLC